MATFQIKNTHEEVVGRAVVIFTANPDSGHLLVYNQNGYLLGNFGKSGWGFADPTKSPKRHCQLPPVDQQKQIATAHNKYSVLIGGVYKDTIYTATELPVTDGVVVGTVGQGIWTEIDEELISILGNRLYSPDPKGQELHERIAWSERERAYRLHLYALAAGCGALLCALLKSDYKKEILDE